MSANETMPRPPALELLGRYRAVLHAAWAARHHLPGPRRLADETAFLPAALSLQETPAFDHRCSCRAAVGHDRFGVGSR